MTQIFSSRRQLEERHVLGATSSELRKGRPLRQLSAGKYLGDVVGVSITYWNTTHPKNNLPDSYLRILKSLE